jgi:hypothetical protein
MPVGGAEDGRKVVVVVWAIALAGPGRRWGSLASNTAIGHQDVKDGEWMVIS